MQADEIYNLVTQSFVTISFEQPILIAEVNERAFFHPISPYAVSKIMAHWAAVNYHKAYGILLVQAFCLTKFPLRGLEFVIRKITSVARIKYGLQDKIVLNNFSSKRNWGYVPEYVEVMWFMLQQNEPDDYVIATNETHLVREFVELAFKIVDIDIKWEGEGVNE